MTRRARALTNELVHDLVLLQDLALASARTFDLERDISHDIDHARALTLAAGFARDFGVGLDRAVDLALEYDLAQSSSRHLDRNLKRAREIALTRTIDHGLAAVLAATIDNARVRAQLRSPSSDHFCAYPKIRAEIDGLHTQLDVLARLAEKTVRMLARAERRWWPSRS